MPRPTVAEINLEAIAHNLREVKRRIGPDVRLLAAVKADAYGHGAVAVSQTALEHGAEYLGVASAEEGVELRHAGIKAPVLVFGALGGDDVATVLKYYLTPALSSLDFARTLDRQAEKFKKRVKVHVKVDTGMGRLGFLPDELADAAAEIASMKSLMLEGLMTHFPTADEEDKAFTYVQIERMKRAMVELRERGVAVPLIHAANSGAVLDVPESWFNMVRLGLSLYGYYPMHDVSQATVKLTPAMSLKTRIVHLKQVPPGASISYGRTFVTERVTDVATVPVGYADGLDRKLSNRGKMIVKGDGGREFACPIIGRVCMDLTMIDVTGAAGAGVGSEVIVYSPRRDDPNSVESTARLIDTIPYVVTCSVSKRVPRIYLPAKPPLAAQ